MPPSRSSHEWRAAQADDYAEPLRSRIASGEVEPPDEFVLEDDLECTHCGGEGLCWDGSDPLGNCPDEPHRCHACGGSGKRRDQTLF